MFNKRNEPEEPHHDIPLSMPAANPPPSRAARDAATIGPSIHINGDLSGEEDLVVQGRVEGTITLKQNTLRVGKEGHVSATVRARVIDVEGRVEGDMNGEEQVVLHKSAQVTGNISAPRVTLEDGCRFKGSIDMDNVDAQAGKSPKVTDFKPARTGEATRGTGLES
ncbi:MAG: polymer-forming cytoskeletal protein [Planctomycetes bacterium]|nr:polymer-forming cytoskeletal protein [Planctomycetota bacterium]